VDVTPATPPTARRVAVVGDAGHYVGPELARMLARRHHDLVLGDAPTHLVEELRAAGVEVHVVEGVADLGRPDAAQRLVDAATGRFGRIDAAVAASGRIVTGRFVSSTAEQFETVITGCLMAPYHFLRAVAPVMVEQGSGQVLVITSAAAARPTPGAPLYSAARAGATMLARNVAGEVARHGVQVNAVGTNFMDFPEFLAATGATDPEVRAAVEAQVPLGRLGTMEEFASFCGVFLDGTSTFTTGQFVAYAGGWA
jgi:NAD(P)-dependent dehydrogenase (short-subunit alcohol dehydrogenase family)